MSTIRSSAGVGAANVRAGLTGGRRDVTGTLFQVLLLASLLFSLAVLLVLVVDVLEKALPVFADRGIGFLTSPLSSNPAKAGVGQGIIGTVVLAGIVAVVAFPIGLATAIYLEEYASDTRFTRFIQINIRNLAGVPSVVYGLLGLSVFVAFFNSIDGTGNGRNIVAGGLALAVLVLPIVIITSIEALRAVPNTIREAGYGVGASRWEVTSQLVLPAARPGILTGTVLALSRALGETAVLVIAGAVLGSFSGLSISTLFTGSYTALPMIVYDWSRKPQDAFRDNAAAAIVVLLAITLFANVVAIYPPQPFRADLVMSDHPGDAPMIELATPPAAAGTPSDPAVAHEPPEPVLRLENVHFYYSSFRAVKDITLEFAPRRITALIGPSGCGKSTLLRTFNRMNDLIPGTRVEGEGPLPRPGPVREGRGRGRGPAPHRHGLPEGQPVPEVDLRQRGLRPPDQRLQGRPRRPRGGQPQARRALERRQGQAQGSQAWRSPAASSSACASPGRSRPTRT